MNKKQIKLTVTRSDAKPRRSRSAVREKPKKVWVRVTKRDIEQGRCRSITACAVARALQRRFRDVRCWAGPVDLHVYGKYYATPKRVQRFMDAFDDGRKVRPFRFALPRRSH